MPVPAMVANVYRMLPNRQAVRLLPKNPEGVAIDLVDCVWRPWSKDDTALAGTVGLESERRTLLYPSAPNQGIVAKNGDKVTDADGISWTVKTFTKELEGAMIRCPCVRQVS
jgi:hypothetical protein